MFDRYIGIDYSGAETSEKSLSGLRVFSSRPNVESVEVPPPPGPRKYWSRRGIAMWLRETLLQSERMIVGIDHAFSFPLRYFETHRLQHDWSAFLDDFQQHWPTDTENTYVQFVRDGILGSGAARWGDSKWRRLTEKRAGAAKSVFQFGVQGSVAHSTHAGLPWLRYLRRELGNRIHFWPFEGWTVPPDKSVVVEVYPSLWSHGYPRNDRTDDQHDAYAVAEWFRETDASGKLGDYFQPSLDPDERVTAEIEGWILGIG